MAASPDDPVVGQTDETISAYLLRCSTGDAVAIRSTQGIGVKYVITALSDVDPRKGRLYTITSASWGGRAWYRKTGKSCLHPKGQSRLVEPTEAVRDFASRYPIGRIVKAEVDLSTGHPPIIDVDQIMQTTSARYRS